MSPTPQSPSRPTKRHRLSLSSHLSTNPHTSATGIELTVLGRTALEHDAARQLAESRIAVLEQQVHSLERDNARLTAEWVSRQDLEQANKELRERAVDAEQELDDRREALDDAELRAEAAEERADDEADSRALCQRELRDAREHINDVLGQLNDLRDQAAADRRGERDRYDQLRCKAEALRRDYGKLADLLQETQARRLEAEGKVRALRGEGDGAE